MANALIGGSLPVPPADLLQALSFAAFRDTPYKEKALANIRSMPESVIFGVLLGPLDPPDTLGLVLQNRKEPSLLETALLHQNLTAEIVEASVPSLPGAVLEIVVNNQVLWMKRPVILDLLEEHPDGDYHLKRRINEFRFDVLKTESKEEFEERIEILDEVQAGRLDKAWAELPRAKEMPGEDFKESENEEAKAAVFEHKPILDDEGNDISLSVTQRIMKLRTNQKIMLAIKGGKEERTILIREANRLIQSNVIRNPRITESEVAAIAQMRAVNEEVLRIISMSREWMRKYTIYKALVVNPRTPLPIAMSNYKRLMESDLKLLMKDKNVNEALRRETKRYLDQKGSGKG
jgi:hypothetical protein